MDEKKPQNQASVPSDTGSATPEPGYLSLSEASRGTPYSQEYLSLLVRKGKLAGKKFGRNWHVQQSAIQAYIAEQSQKAADKAGSLGDLAKVSQKSNIVVNIRPQNDNFVKKKPFLPLSIRQIALIVVLSFVLTAPAFASIFGLQDQIVGLRTQFSQILAQTPPNVHTKLSEKYVKDLIAAALGGLKQKDDVIASEVKQTLPEIASGSATPRKDGTVLGTSTGNDFFTQMRLALATGLPDDIKQLLQGPPGPHRAYPAPSPHTFPIPVQCLAPPWPARPIPAPSVRRPLVPRINLLLVHCLLAKRLT